MKCPVCNKFSILEREETTHCPHCKFDLEEYFEKAQAIEFLEIENLFGYLNYKIDYKTPDNVAIFIAPNGCGKTTIFNFLDFFFNPSPDSLKKIINIPVERFVCNLSKGTQVVYENSKISHIQRMTINTKEKSVHFNIEATKNIDDNFVYPRFKKLETKDNEQSSTKFEYICQKISDLLTSTKTFVPLSYISTNRISSGKEQNQTLAMLVEDSEPISTPEQCYLHSRKILMNMSYAYRRRLESTTNSLPMKFLSTDQPQMSYSDFMKKWNDYKETLKQYREIGLLPPMHLKPELFNLKISETDYNASKGVFLSVYITELIKPLNLLQPLYKKMKLFSEIFNERNKITNKTIRFNAPDGISVLCNGKNLPLNCLSSGEKNDIVLFYKLIFASEAGETILIDEPEISLHIEWQETFIDRLLEICKLNKLNALVATHSPYIINSHDNLLAKQEVQNGNKN
ncbi:MAG: AAA family ATPase [Clostridia bacterium]|nr:AAA family ATPase [Clostridia bacterium]